MSEPTVSATIGFSRKSFPHFEARVNACGGSFLKPVPHCRSGYEDLHLEFDNTTSTALMEERNHGIALPSGCQIEEENQAPWLQLQAEQAEDHHT
jgi:hypothetical protein